MATPDGWAETSLDSIVRRADGLFTDGDWIESKDQSVDGNIRLLQVGNVLRGRLRESGTARWVSEATVSRLGCTLLEPGDILIARMPDPPGRACIVPTLRSPAITAVDCAIVRVREVEAVRAYLIQLFNSDEHLREVASRMSGTTRQRISRAQLGTIPVLLPTISEQRKIAAILSSIDDAIEKTEVVVAQLEVVKKAMMQELLTRGMPGRHTRFKQTEIGEIPDSWELRTLDELLDSIDAGWSPQCETRPARNSEWGVLKVSAVSSGQYLAEQNKALPPDLEPRATIEVRPGDVLLARASGVLELVGTTAFVFETRPNLMLSDKVMRLRPSRAMDGRFLHYSMQSEAARKQIVEFCGGSHMRNLAQASLRAVRVGVPPIAEQREIAERIRSIEVSLSLEAVVLDRLRTTKGSTSTVLLTGAARVTPAEIAP